ncbi:MAG TPA: oxidoreductase [Acetobacteraceae bacterium]|nr:oxidoreductase [Acetobacteraceae bacterium]
MAKEINVALIGYGYAGRVFHAPLILGVPGLRLHSVTSSDPAKVLADHPEVRVVTAEDAFADPAIDLAVIATPNEFHAPLAHAALAQGKHVVVDKPFTLTVAEAEGLADHARRAGRLLAVFHNRRWDADFLTLRRLITERRLGEVVQFESHFDRFRPQPRDRWRERAGPGSGLWFDLGPHLADQALCLFGMPEEVEADLALLRQGTETNDYFHVLLRYPRRRVILHGTALAAAKPLRFAVHGTESSFVKHGFDPQEDRLKAGGMPDDPGFGADPEPGELTSMRSGSAETQRIQGEPGDYRQFYASIREAIRQDAPNPVPPREAVAVMEVIEAAIESAGSGRRIRL